VLAGLGGSAVALIRRRRGVDDGNATAAALLFTALAATLLLVPDLYQFTWRYQLSALITLPPAGVLALSALITSRRARAAVSADGLTAGAAAAGAGQRQPDELEDVLGRPGPGSHAGGESSSQ